MYLHNRDPDAVTVAFWRFPLLLLLFNLFDVVTVSAFA
jgi:hypothetical protein